MVSQPIKTGLLAAWQRQKRQGRSRKKLKHLLRKIRNISAKKITRVRKHAGMVQDIEPLKLGRRLVLRSRAQVPVKKMVALHGLYRDESMWATKFLSESLSGTMEGEPIGISHTSMRCLLRAKIEEYSSVAHNRAFTFADGNSQAFESHSAAHWALST